jgi:hypothetical protein
MKIFRGVAARMPLSISVAILCVLLTSGTVVQTAEFFCPSGNVTCLIAAINNANALPGEHVIHLEPGTYTLQSVDNTLDGANGLPSITRTIRIQASAKDPPTVIERDPAATLFRILHVSFSGVLVLEGVTIQRGLSSGAGREDEGNAIINLGVTTLQDSIVTESADSGIGAGGAINNIGVLNVFNSTLANNLSHHDGGAIFNQSVGRILVENSTVAHNTSSAEGGIRNEGSAVIRDTAIISNTTDCCQRGGGIHNRGGSLEIINSTIAKNIAGGCSTCGGGGVVNIDGQVSITNSTLRANQTFEPSSARGGGILNISGTVQIKNTIVAGNITPFAPDCSGTITSLGNNLIGDPSGCDINLQTSDLTGDPGLGSLVGAGEKDLPGRAHYPVLPGSAVINRGDPTACSETDQLGIPRVGTCDIGAVEFLPPPLLVFIDIRPHSDANQINPASSQRINVAIFSANGFRANSLDPNTVRFGPTGSEAIPVQVALRDLNKDGQSDMILRFRVDETGIGCGDTSAFIKGQTSSGLPIIGSTSFITVGCK